MPFKLLYRHKKCAMVSPITVKVIGADTAPAVAPAAAPIGCQKSLSVICAVVSNPPAPPIPAATGTPTVVPTLKPPKPAPISSIKGSIIALTSA